MLQHWGRLRSDQSDSESDCGKIWVADRENFRGYYYDFTDDTRAAGCKCFYFSGFQLAGVWGAAAATAGCVAGGIVLSLLLYVFFKKKGNSFYMTHLLKGLKAASTGLILSAAGTILLLTFWGSSDIGQLSLSGIEIRSVALFVSALLLPRIIVPLFTKGKVKGLGPVALMLLTGAAGFFLYH